MSNSKCSKLLPVIIISSNSSSKSITILISTSITIISTIIIIIIIIFNLFLLLYSHFSVLIRFPAHDLWLIGYISNWSSCFQTYHCLKSSLLKWKLMMSLSCLKNICGKIHLCSWIQKSRSFALPDSSHRIHLLRKLYFGCFRSISIA